MSSSAKPPTARPAKKGAQAGKNSFFVGLGVGAWMTSGDDEIPSEDSQADLIANIGLRLFGTPASTSAAVFIEGRAATDELDELEDFGRIGGGLRFRF